MEIKKLQNNRIKCQIPYPHNFKDYPCEKCNYQIDLQNYISYVLSKNKGGANEEKIIKEATKKFYEQRKKR